MNTELFLDPINLRRDVRETLMALFSRYLRRDMRVYDIGCGDKPFASFLEGRVAAHIGVDIEDGFYDSGHIDLVGTACEVPAPDGDGDAVISSQVIEHLERPLDAFDETARLLKPGGLFFLAYPFIYPVHAAPVDYGRYTEHYIEARLRERGFEILEMKRIGGFWYCAGFFTGLYLQNFDRGILGRIRIIRLLVWLAEALALGAHKLESLIFRLAGKDIQGFRSMWTCNYIYVAMKKKQESQEHTP